MGFAKHFCPKNLASRRICVIVYPKRLLAQKPSAMEAFGMTNIMLYTLREAMLSRSNEDKQGKNAFQWYRLP